MDVTCRIYLLSIQRDLRQSMYVGPTAQRAKRNIDLSYTLPLAHTRAGARSTTSILHGLVPAITNARPRHA
eukprot:COSAG01_NODE_3503_length_5997_cov_2.186843_2_plen_71_part_00